MAWTLTDGLDAFHAAAGAFLHADPVTHTQHLTVIHALRERGPYAFGQDGPVYGWWSDDAGDVAGAFVHTPPFPMLLTPTVEAALEPLAEALMERAVPGAATLGVNARGAVADAFAQVWTARTGAVARVVQSQRLFRLGTLTPPDPAPAGRARDAERSDIPVLADYVRHYQVESSPEAMASDEIAAHVEMRLVHGGYTLWERDGDLVSFAGQTPAIAGAARVGPVYTPPEHRGHGYGTAVTAARTATALASGADEVLLFTDLANPTSNNIYRKIGYEPVEDRVILAFDPRP
ncbi:GNAT family N-acetyltransferase [Yinghuangia sp. YIM S09857]|uniref:GNAT family N-acetyltransferase n=1 Tax=Yinghuangia sp. YIM S09857 TaxID=3436929 RepID=UPI003F536765